MQRASPNSSDGQKTPPEPRSTVVLLTIADTTWRMFVPSIGCVFLGVWADSSWGTGPWLLFAGIVIGLSIGALAVRQQYKKLIDL